MSTYRLDRLLRPSSVAVVGASPRPGSLGGVVLRGLKAGGFKGALFAVNPRHAEVEGVACLPSLSAIGVPVDLVVVATPAAITPGIIEDACASGAQTAIVLTAGLGHGPDSPGEAIRARARASGLRIVGPNCLGVLSPPGALNASFALRLPRAGSLALISQSGAIAAGVVEWAARRDVGFSGIVSLGDAADVDFGDCLDHFAEDHATRAILLYVEGIVDARKFMSAARKAARVKPVIVLKAGRHKAGAEAAATHTGALAGSDEVYAAAFERAGCLRVTDLDELFEAAGTLATQPPFHGDRLAILTNGGGLGVLAVDRILDLNGRLAELSVATMEALDKALPPTWSKANPVDIIGDAPAARYAAAMEALLAEPGCDAILAMNCPTALTSAAAAAEAVIDAVKAHRAKAGHAPPVFSVWLGADDSVRQRFHEAGIPSHDTEASAARGIMHLVEARRRRAALLGVHAPLPEPILPERHVASAAIGAALAEGRGWLTPVENWETLRAYGVASVPVRLAANGREAAAIAGDILADGGGCAVKIHSRDISHKSDVDGVRLGLTTAESVRTAAEDILARARALRPQARIDGVTVQPMVIRPHAREVIIGMTVDPTFGPVIAFGHGGTAVEVIADRALQLLPVDLSQARALIAGTRVARLLAGYRNVPAADRDKLAMMLVRVSRLIEDNPEIIGLDLNPVLANETEALALDARIQVARLAGEEARHGRRESPSERRFAIRPYPRRLEQSIALNDGSLLPVRPMRPTDDEALVAMARRCTPEDIRLRFFHMISAPDPELLARLTQIDYAREMAFVALDPRSQEILGVVRMHGDANGDTAEYAILVRSDQQGRGMGLRLMELIIAFARAEGYQALVGQVMADNAEMLAMCELLGFSISASDEGDIKNVRLAL